MAAIRSTVIGASVPGRLRLRHACLRDARRGRELAARIAAINGVLGTDTNPVTGSVLVHYDASQCAREVFERAAVAAFAEVCPSPAAAVIGPLATPRSGNYHWEIARRWNRAAKWGMLASFPVSLALAAAGSKKLHAVTGGLFSVLLLVHLYVHRRHLIK